MKNVSSSKVAVVTGAAGTLCSVIAMDLAKKGYKIALLGRDIRKLDEVKDAISASGGQALSIATDVTDFNEVSKARDIIISGLGIVSVLINGAGGNQMEAVTTGDEFDKREAGSAQDVFRGFLNMDLERYQNVLEINTMGTVIPCQIFGNEMIRAKSGSIINFSSMNGVRPLSRVPAYAMAKAGINNFTQWLAAYLAPANIRVNAIAPGFFINEKNKLRLYEKDGSYSERGRNIIRQTPMHRFGEAPELTGCINWLIDEEASGFVTGTIIPIDGGFLASSGI